MKTRFFYYQLPILFYALFAREALADPETFIVPDQYPTIQSAIVAAAPGDTVQVKAGTYSENLVIDQEGIRLIGEGRNLVTVQSSATNLVLDCGKWKTGLISGITFQHTNKTDNKNRYCVVGYGMLGSIEIKDCRIQMGDGDGIGIDNASPKITGCIIENNRGAGILVDGTGFPEIRNNECQKNQDGIKIVDGGGGNVEGNVCEDNSQFGIEVHEDAVSLTLKSNQCRDNKVSGIIFGGGARGDAEQNVCEKNTNDGIDVMGSGTAPTLKSNQCRNNTACGISFSRGARGYAEGNVCEYNNLAGIAVSSSNSAPTLKSNQCRSNNSSGIVFGGGAQGDAEENICENNTQDGIDVIDSGTAPTLKSNQCQQNRAGIGFWYGSGGDAEGNVCENNKKHGIAVSYADTHPHIDSNICRKNGGDGILCTSSSTPQIGDNNQIYDNQNNQIVTNAVDPEPGTDQ